jgi:hypothetical protein
MHESCLYISKLTHVTLLTIAVECFCNIMMIRLLDWGYQCTARAVNAAAKGGQQECLHFLLEHGRPYYEETIALSAARGGNVIMLHFLEQTQTGL